MFFFYQLESKHVIFQGGSGLAQPITPKAWISSRRSLVYHQFRRNCISSKAINRFLYLGRYLLFPLRGARGEERPRGLSGGVAQPITPKTWIYQGEALYIINTDYCISSISKELYIVNFEENTYHQNYYLFSPP